MDAQMNGKRLPELDVMRTMAIAIIVFHHLSDYTFNYYRFDFMGLNFDLSFIHGLNADLAVGVFIFISGMLHGPSFAAGHDAPPVSAYIRKRFLRIYPLYLLSFFLFMLEFGYYPGARFIAVHLLGLQVLLANGPHSEFPTIWFIGLLVAYEAVFLITLKYGTSRPGKTAIIAGAFCACLVAKLYAGVVDERFFEYYALYWIGIFGAGFLFGLDRRFKTVIIAAALAAAYVYAKDLYAVSPERLLKTRPVYWLEFFITTNVIMLGFTMFAHGLGAMAAASGSAARAFFRQAAFASYAVYLFHRHVWYAMLLLYRPGNGLARLIYLSAAGIPVIALLSWLIQSLYDRLTGRPRASAPPVVALR